MLLCVAEIPRILQWDGAGLFRAQGLHFVPKFPVDDCFVLTWIHATLVEDLTNVEGVRKHVENGGGADGPTLYKPSSF